ncbi:antibiotic biosynthesis monooxygenase [Staphylococcus sp. IVB6227]|uniref:putative quinol monooxygenase n=1 Tax=Staphylococcus sp. IVB6227 TaxID=2989768 RepID=UPI0021D2C6B6|nr:antibiotic biosynthesis monooxygenase [Staphylococcus sp. IVB6227]UXR77537.1 antibiotic biosynthesis monooxygenase [Staphylococcus sp. IVB6227]
MTEIFRVFKLEIKDSYQDEFFEVGKNNFKQSIQLEEGTLGMFTAHLPTESNQKIVVERYESDKAYQKHINSSHFKVFSDLAKVAVKSSEVITLNPKVFLQKSEPLNIYEQTDLSVRLATVKVSNNHQFADMVLPFMKWSIAAEKGTLLLYAGIDNQNPNTWYFFEIYQNDEAYDAHLETAQFKAYIQKSKDLVHYKELQVLSDEMLVTQSYNT